MHKCSFQIERFYFDRSINEYIVLVYILFFYKSVQGVCRDSQEIDRVKFQYVASVGSE